jgi:surface antigen Omp85-like protein
MRLAALLLILAGAPALAGVPVLAAEPATTGSTPSSATTAPDTTASSTDSGATPAAPATGQASKTRSPEDGAFDIGGFLDETYGFVPLLVPITEPAVGYGAAGGLVFIDRTPGTTFGGPERPNMTAVGGLATENGTRGLMAADLRHWRDNRIQTVVGVIDASVNLDFFGIGKDNVLNDHPRSYNLEPLGGGVRARYRFGDSHVWGGMTYALADTKVTFDEDAALAGLAGQEGDSRVGGLVPSISYDSRDNIFTPGRGIYFDGSAGFFSPVLGGDDTFQRVGLSYIQYWALRPRVTLGVRGGATFTFGETPFYMLPYVSLRGAPVMRYQGEEEAETEVEARWQFYKRWSVVGFAGGGAAWNDFERLDDRVGVVTGGTGMRYELAHKYGLHAGVDVAFGPDGTAFYIQFGSAWFRP